MGNSASQSSNIPQQQIETEDEWAHSFPRTLQRTYQHKVLPDCDAPLKLRPTNNGEILQSGGTLSGRHHPNLAFTVKDSENFDRQNSNGHSHVQNSNADNILKYKQSPSRFSSRYAQNGLHSHHNTSEVQIKRFGSEPNLWNCNEHTNIEYAKVTKDKGLKGKKKYKAPAPPQTNFVMGMSSSNDSSNFWERRSNEGLPEIMPPARRARLFKTQAEMKRKVQPVNHDKNLYEHNHQLDFIIDDLNKTPKDRDDYPTKYDDAVTYRQRERNAEKPYRLSLPEMNKVASMPEFQAELRDVTQRLRIMNEHKREITENTKNGAERIQNSSGNNLKAKDEHKLKTLDHNLSDKEYVRRKMRQLKKIGSQESVSKTSDNTSANNYEIYKKKEFDKECVANKLDEIKEPPKMFYFGMNGITKTADEQLNHFYDNNVIDKFAESLQQNQMISPASSGSHLSSELEMDYSNAPTNIDLQLRPILPKKQLEIPRFSPAVAWRLLSAIEVDPAPSTIMSDEGSVFIEDKIEKLSRPPPPPAVQVAGPRSSLDKSGDSGISGDAGPVGFEDGPENLVLNSRTDSLQRSLNEMRGMSWTPQQDLEEDSASDGENAFLESIPAKFPQRPHVFSLSLPRENHLTAYIEEKARLQSHTGLQKLKRSVSGVLGSFGRAQDDTVQTYVAQDKNENWFLSRSAPNSLSNGFNSLDLKSTKYNKEESGTNVHIQMPVTHSNINSGRLMYLPESDKLQWNKHALQQVNSHNTKTSEFDEKAQAFETTQKTEKDNQWNISIHSVQPEQQNLQDPLPSNENKIKKSKPKRFTFQSTVRQIERRRLAEKLSKEAERKERQRVSEVEAMRQVEEEFQRKRAREKASIRQQLHLFRMEDNTCLSLPPNLEAKDSPATRSDPDGAVSSSASSPTFVHQTKYENNNGLQLSGNKWQHKSDRNAYRSKADGRNNQNYKKVSSHLIDFDKRAQATTVLSEYKQPQREYKEYRGRERYLSDGGDCDVKKTTVYPQITCNMPSVSRGHQDREESPVHSNNYRRDFAHGIVPPSKS